MQGIRGEQGKAIRIEGMCKSSQKVRFLIRLVSDGREDRQVELYFSTDDSMDGREVLDYYRTRFQLEFCF